VRNISAIDAADLRSICDLNPGRLQKIGRTYPAAYLTTNYDDILQNPEVGAVAISTPVNTHYPLAKAALEAGKHVFIEKPMTSSAETSEELVALAAKNNLVLGVDHTFTYTGAVRKIKDLIDTGTLGALYYIDSVRVNLGLFQHDVNVIWDLAPHDLSIIDYLTAGQMPDDVVAVGATHLGHHANVAYVTLRYQNDFIAHLHLNWLAPVKVRQMLIGGSNKMVVYDDVEPSEKVRVYDKGASAASAEEIYKTLVSYRTGDMLAPRLDMSEALYLELTDFVNAVLKNAPLRNDGAAGMRVVRILEAAQKSLEDRGKPVRP
jgi:predicted dehydrogenase